MTADDFFRLGVGAVICHGGRVLACERADHPGSWQLPQGGIDRGEAVEDALFREIEEETGFTRNDLQVRVELPVWLGYELPEPAQRARIGRGQVHRWFVLDLRAGVPPRAPALGREFRSWEWRDLVSLAETVVEFRRPVYRLLIEWASGHRV